MNWPSTICTPNIDGKIPEDIEFRLPNLVENQRLLASCLRHVSERGMVLSATKCRTNVPPSHLQLKRSQMCRDLTAFSQLSLQYSVSLYILNGHQFSLFLFLKDPSKRLMKIKLLFTDNSLLSLLAQLITKCYPV